MACALMFPASTARANDKPIVAVFDIESRGAPVTAEQLSNLTEIITSKLPESGRYKIVPRGELQSALQSKKAESYNVCYEQSCQIEIGKELAASKTLSTKVVRIADTCVVTMQMFDLKENVAELAASAEGGCAVGEILTALRAAVAKLVRPNASTPASAEARIGQPPPPPPPRSTSRKTAKVSFSSYPPGAMVTVNGQVVCQDSRNACSKRLPLGEHEVRMQKAGYLARTQRVTVRGPTKVSWDLDANVARVSVYSQPPGLEVRIDGQVAGKTPLTNLELPAGRHEVRITGPCHRDSGRRFSLQRGEDKVIRETLRPRRGKLRAQAQAYGSPVTARVYVDGEELGETPGTFEVSTCSKRLDIKHPTLGNRAYRIRVSENETIDVNTNFETTPVAADQVWRGRYVCNQGKTDLELKITKARKKPNGNTRVKAVFVFHHRPTGAKGSFKLSGTYRKKSRSLSLEPGKWIKRPGLYETVGMSGKFSHDGTRYEGRIKGPNCKQFELKRVRP